ncbi:MAG: division/cell wall cluster transcriptional repressor MraZ [Clostridia bacterium]|nr:division/cell wall cluster transcriptional repressor MraZ [Clostridia bacterium]
MFLGEYCHSLDEKGRLTLPSRFREELGDPFVVTKGLDKCLFAYPRAEWEALGEKLRTLPFTQAKVRSFVRFFFSGAAECSPDRQGRVLLPPSLRDYAGLTRDVMVVGVANRVEVWDAATWRGYLAEAEAAYAEVAESMPDLNL